MVILNYVADDDKAVFYDSVINGYGLAIQNSCPIIGIYDSGGARINEGVNYLAGCEEMMHYNTLASGYI